MRRRTPLVIASAIVAAAFALRFSPLWPGPALPVGATGLHIETEAPHLLPAFGCHTALLEPVRVATSDDDLVFLSVSTGEPAHLGWPSGWAAWRLDGRAELVSRDGSVFAREGEELEYLGGGLGAVGDAFYVCVVGG